METKEYIEALNAFFSSNARETNAMASKAPSKVFFDMAEQTALDTFKLASSTVPAYKDFLKKHKIDARKINTIDDFKKVPLTSKKNYLSQYPLKDLLAEGDFNGKFASTSSSGSSGKPFFWPRYFTRDVGVVNGIESTLVDLFDIDKKSTLLVNCAGMGVWTAGDLVSFAFKIIALKYKNNSSISPGIDIDNTLWSIETIGESFEQIVILGYPPFIKDLVDQLPSKTAKAKKIKIIAGGESFSESWRSYVGKKLGVNKAYKNICSMLGSSEGGFVGSEYGLSVFMRQKALENVNLCKGLFGRADLPTLVQYGPKSKYFEQVGSQLVITDKGGLPLVRYDTKDSGGILSQEDIASKYQEIIGKPLEEDIKKEGIVAYNMPYVYLFGRADYSATLYGITISPEQVKDVLISDEVNNLLTGRFTMRTVYDKSENQNLEITCELRRGVKGESVDEEALGGIIGKGLTGFSTEYSKLLSSMKERVLPVIKLRTYGDKQYFSSKNKQQYLG